MARPSMDPEDVASLCRAKEASQKRRSELALPGGSWHCRRRTRGLEETTRSIGSLIDLFDSSDGKFLCSTTNGSSRYGRNNGSTFSVSKTQRTFQST